MGGTLHDGLLAQAPALVAQFAAVRARARDPGVKGSAIEEIVRDFLVEHLSCGMAASRSEVFDSFDRVSGEVDVLLCNEDQPFRKGPFLAEGVHAAIQVKAILTTEELDRIDRNCRSVKALRRRVQAGDAFFRPGSRTDAELARVPYIVMCFETELSAETLSSRLLQRYWAKDDLLDQPDAIFVLAPGLSFLNCRVAQPPMLRGSTSGKPLAGWVRQDSGEATLAAFLRFLVLELPWFRRIAHPLRHYFDSHLPFDTYGLEQVDAPPNEADAGTAAPASPPPGTPQ